MAKKQPKKAKSRVDNKSARKLTPKQELFVKEYLIDFNATQAAIRAGYSAKTAKEQASRLLTNINVSEAVAASKAKKVAKLDITADRVLQEMARIAFVDVGKLLNDDGSMKPLSEMDEDARRAIVGIDVAALRDEDGDYAGTIKKIKLADKKGALADLGKHFGLFDQKVTVDAKGDGLSLLIQAVQGSSFKPVAKLTGEDEED